LWGRALHNKREPFGGRRREIGEAEKPPKRIETNLKDEKGGRKEDEELRRGKR
jgi:hypothetical protein